MDNGEAEHTAKDAGLSQRRSFERLRWATLVGSLAVLVVTAAVLLQPKHEETRTNPDVAAKPSAADRPDPPSQPSLADSFNELSATLDADVGIVLEPVGRKAEPVVLGGFQGGPAWSTMKIPLVIAALRKSDQAKVTDSMVQAVTHSDNAAAEAIWSELGDPTKAAEEVDKVLRAAGDDQTKVQSERIRPGFTAFGQTEWSLTDQAKFMAFEACQADNKDIQPAERTAAGLTLGLMSQIADDQRWGLGRLEESKFKGGWGPDPSGMYLVRQIGVIPAGDGLTAVALAAQPASGSLQDGEQNLDALSRWLQDHADQLPLGHCEATG